MTPADLSKISQPVSDLFSQPSKPEDWDPYRLTQEQIDFFHEYGYLSGIKILEEHQISLLLSELEDLIDPNYSGNELFHEYHSNESSDPDKVVFHALGHWRIKPGFHDVLWSPAFCMAAKQLLGGGVRFWHDQLFCKPPHHGGNVAWHQDYSYWTRTVPMAHLTCWIGLDDADRTNGCLQYIPGSHRWGLLEKPELAGDMNGLVGQLSPNQRQALSNPEYAEMKAGYGTFHHPLMVHGSAPNTSNRSRRACVINAFKDGTQSNTHENLLQGVPVIPPGQKLEGDFFPLLIAE